ncbi:MAG: hypothetical protein H8E15_09575 [Planctomycetes bacterium]|nr:hypothetical protein [Planctomycetota bacterium]
MTPTAAVLQALAHPGILVLSLVLKWWAIWFTLGHFFRRTTLLLLAAVGCSWVCGLVILSSGAVGELVSQPHTGMIQGSPTWFSWAISGLIIWAAIGALETLVLRWGMRKSQRATWAWRRSDLWVYLMWHGFIVLVATWLAVDRAFQPELS